MSTETVPCPHCGGPIRADAKFCRHCGSSDADGWREFGEETEQDDDFDYQAYVSEHHSEGRQWGPGISAGWRFVAIVLLLAFAASVLSLL